MQILPDEIPFLPPVLREPTIPARMVRVQLVGALETYRSLRAAYVARGDAGTRFRAEEARERVKDLTALLAVAEKVERAGLSGHPMEVA